MFQADCWAGEEFEGIGGHPTSLPMSRMMESSHQALRVRYGGQCSGSQTSKTSSRIWSRSWWDNQSREVERLADAVRAALEG